MKTPIEILDEMIDELNPEWFIPSNTDSIVTSYLREAKERIQKETWWIDVNEEEPEPDTDVLVAYYWFNRVRIVRGAEANCEKDWKTMRYYSGNLREIENATHWMPLPTPPNN
jgi:hypothetical protein